MYLRQTLVGVDAAHTTYKLNWKVLQQEVRCVSRTVMVKVEQWRKEKQEGVMAAVSLILTQGSGKK